MELAAGALLRREPADARLAARGWANPQQRRHRQIVPFVEHETGGRLSSRRTAAECAFKHDAGLEVEGRVEPGNPNAFEAVGAAERKRFLLERQEFALQPLVAGPPRQPQVAIPIDDRLAKRQQPRGKVAGALEA